MSETAVAIMWVVFGVFDIIALISGLCYYKNKKKGKGE